MSNPNGAGAGAPEQAARDVSLRSGPRLQRALPRRFLAGAAQDPCHQPGPRGIEVIVVDDCSKDDTPAVLAQFERALRPDPKMTWRFLRHEHNGGKGQAIRTALEHATCQITVIHAADLEYHPPDLLRIGKVLVQEHADAVFGSRFIGGEVRRGRPSPPPPRGRPPPPPPHPRDD